MPRVNRRLIWMHSSWPPRSGKRRYAKPSLWLRWVQACQKPRWQVAFASLVGVALYWRWYNPTPEQAPGYDFAPKASAPQAKKEFAEAPAAARSLAAPAPAVPMADFAAPAQSESLNAQMAEEANVSKRAAAPVKSLDEQLREVLRLQKNGHKQAADKLLADLHKRFPDENLDGPTQGFAEKLIGTRFNNLASRPESAHYRAIVDALALP